MKTYVFDIDGTICTNTNGEYKLAEPLLDRIIFINKLYEEGNIIKFFTHRRFNYWNKLANLLKLNLKIGS